MHLQQHLGGQIRNRGGHPDHGAADHICRRALDRRVDCGAFGKAGTGAFGVDFGRMDFAAEQGLHIAVVLRKFYRRCHVFFYAGEAFKIAVDKPLRFGAWNAQIAR